jgi:hypothetical protein
MRRSPNLKSVTSSVFTAKKSFAIVAATAVMAVTFPTTGTAAPWSTIPRTQNCFRRYSIAAFATYFDESPESLVPDDSTQFIPEFTSAGYRYDYALSANGADVWVRFRITPRTFYRQISNESGPVGVETTFDEGTATFELPRSRWSPDYPTYVMTVKRSKLNGVPETMGTWTHVGSSNGYSEWSSGQPNVRSASIRISHSNVVDYCRTPPRF